MGAAGNSAKSAQNDCEERQQGTFEERIRLVVPRLPLGHQSSKTPEFSADMDGQPGNTSCPEIEWGSTGSAKMIPVSGQLSGVQILAELNDCNGPFPHTNDFQVIGPTFFLMLGSLPRAMLCHQINRHVRGG